jgi:hypothetical protein
MGVGNVHAADSLEIWENSAFRQFRERLAGGAIRTCPAKVAPNGS